MTLCEEKCDLIDYNYNKGKVKCSCEIKTKISPNYDAKFNNQEFFKSFTDIKDIANLNKNKFELIKSRKKRKYNNITNKKSRDNFRNNINNKIYTNNVKLTQDTQNKLLTKLNKKNIVKFKSYDINSIYEREFFEKKDFEINSLEYEEAFKLDKRNFFQYYISLLKYNHPLIFSFGTYNDYNLE